MLFVRAYCIYSHWRNHARFPHPFWKANIGVFQEIWLDASENGILFVEEIQAYGEPICKICALIIQLYESHSRQDCNKKNIKCATVEPPVRNRNPYNALPLNQPSAKTIQNLGFGRDFVLFQSFTYKFKSSFVVFVLLHLDQLGLDPLEFLQKQVPEQWCYRMVLDKFTM